MNTTKSAAPVVVFATSPKAAPKPEARLAKAMAGLAAVTAKLRQQIAPAAAPTVEAPPVAGPLPTPGA